MTVRQLIELLDKDYPIILIDEEYNLICICRVKGIGINPFLDFRVIGWKPKDVDYETGVGIRVEVPDDYKKENDKDKKEGN